MAALTHSSATRNSLGSLRLSTIKFADVSDGDTYDSGITEPVMYWANGTDDPTQTYEKINVNFTTSIAGDPKGRFTLHTAEANRAVTLYILSR